MDAQEAPPPPREDGTGDSPSRAWSLVVAHSQTTGSNCPKERFGGHAPNRSSPRRLCSSSYSPPYRRVASRSSLGRRRSRVLVFASSLLHLYINTDDDDVDATKRG